MPYFYKDQKLKLGFDKTAEKNQATEPVDIQSLARSVQGPVYIYDLDDITERYHRLDQALVKTKHSIHYAMKANSNAGVLSHFAKLGAGADTVSAGEIRKALAAGIAANKIIFSGVAKSKAEIEFALKSEIKQINVESPQELVRISEIAKRLGKVADVAFRLNPDVDPKTHPYITTGFRENKFGMDESFVPELLDILRNAKDTVRLRGLTMHIGSLLFDLAVFQEAIEKTVVVHKRFEAEGFVLDRLDIGGGLGIRYETSDTAAEFKMIDDYGVMVFETLKSKLDLTKTEILTEPGRILVGRSGILVGEVQYVKRAPAKTFAVLNTGMNHLIRPALYGAKHRVLPVVEAPGRKSNFDIVGPICESADFLAKDVELAKIEQGDLIAIADSGAYGFAMASQYNSHELPTEILVRDGKVL